MAASHKPLDTPALRDAGIAISLVATGAVVFAVFSGGNPLWAMMLLAFFVVGPFLGIASSWFIVPTILACLGAALLASIFPMHSVLRTGVFLVALLAWLYAGMAGFVSFTGGA